jgi:hypothetical protein
MKDTKTDGFRTRWFISCVSGSCGYLSVCFEGPGRAVRIFVAFNIEIRAGARSREAVAFGHLLPLDCRRGLGAYIIRPAQAMPGRNLGRRLPAATYSHSIVAGGLELMSYTTRLMPRISLMMRFETRARKSFGSRAQSAVIASVDVTARSVTTFS